MTAQPPTPPAPASPPAPDRAPPTDPSLIALDGLVTAVAVLDTALSSKGEPGDLKNAHEQLTRCYQQLEPIMRMFAQSSGPNPRAQKLIADYRSRAVQLRKRGAALPPTQPNDRAEYERRAKWYEDRAAVKEAGMLIMPHGLRTKSEQCEIVENGRRALANILDGAQRDIAPVDVDVFVTALARGRKNQLPPAQRLLTAEELAAIPVVVTETCGKFDAWAVATWELVAALGGQRNEAGEWEWADAIVDTAENPSGAATGAVVAPVPGQPVVAPTGSRIGKPPPSNGGTP